MRLAWLIRRIPFRILVGLSITLTGILILGVYFLLRPVQGRANTNLASKTSASKAVTPIPDFDAGSVLLAGNTLIDLRTGQILAKQWIEGCGDSPPSIRSYSSKLNLGLLSNGRGSMRAFSRDGELMPPLSADGMNLNNAAFNSRSTEAVFVRDGDLWHGELDWQNSLIRVPKKITDTGYFRPDTFNYNWLWHEGRLLIPRQMKTIEVDIASGSVKECRLDIGQLQSGMNPLGTVALLPINGRQLGVADLLTGESKKHAIGLPIRDFLWLTGSKVAIQIGVDQVAQYDHETKKVTGLWKSPTGITSIAHTSPDGTSFLIATGKSLVIFDAGKSSNAELKLKFDGVRWISNEQLLCSCSAIDTAKRGLWLVRKTGEMERISTQPVDQSSRGSGVPSSMIRTNDGAAFVSRGSLWTFNLTTKELKQVTQSGGLSPILQLLKR